ncbi:hypothetical protein D3C78_1226910 [compost metagenome]
MLLSAEQLLAAVMHLGLQLLQFVQPGALQFQLAQLRLLAFEALQRLVVALVKLGASLVGQRHDPGGLLLQYFVRFFGLFALAIGAAPKLAVDRRVGELFQQFTAVFVVGLEECTELTLGQHHGAGELFEVQAQA